MANECCEYHFDETDKDCNWNSALFSPVPHISRSFSAKDKSYQAAVRIQKNVVFEAPGNNSLMGNANATLFVTRRASPPEEGPSSDICMRHTCSDAAMNIPSVSTIGNSPSPQSLNATYDGGRQVMGLSSYAPKQQWLQSNGGICHSVPARVSAAAGNADSIDLRVVSPEAPIGIDEPELQSLFGKANECDEAEAIMADGTVQWRSTRFHDSKKQQSALLRRRVARPQNFYALQKKGKDTYYTRKQLTQQKIKVCDWSVVFALAGILLTIIESELAEYGTILKGGYISNSIKSWIIVATAVLLALIVKYHWLNAKISRISSGADGWHVPLQMRRILQCVVELAVCVICPFPVFIGNIEIDWQVLSAQNHRTASTTKIPLDAVLSVPMFLRAYLICRFIALHNRRYQDAATRSIAALNYVDVDFPFCLKTMMQERPLSALVTVAVTFWLSMAWVLTQCERYSGVREQNQYLNSIWLVTVTFTSIGYGDLVPQTYCGRALVITTGIMGAGVSSAMIAVISQRMELTRSEKERTPPLPSCSTLGSYIVISFLRQGLINISCDFTSANSCQPFISSVSLHQVEPPSIK